MTQSDNPIADLSYRNYDGPKSIAGARWWPIARNGIRLTLRKKGFWALVVISWLPYLLIVFQLLITSLQPPTSGRNPLRLPEFPEMLAGAYNNWIWILFIALLVGAGSISADNRANALQIYLSKAITKRDYLLGKWMTIFIVLYVVVLLPMLGSTMYGAFNLGVSKFFTDYGWLLPKVFVIAAIPAVIHASVMCGISAWNKSPMITGLVYVGLFFAWTMFTNILSHALEDHVEPITRETIQYFNLQGAISGLGDVIIGVAPRTLFDGRFGAPPPLPMWEPLLLLALTFCTLGILVARARIRAVEVVQG